MKDITEYIKGTKRTKDPQVLLKLLESVNEIDTKLILIEHFKDECSNTTNVKRVPYTPKFYTE